MLPLWRGKAVLDCNASQRRRACCAATAVRAHWRVLVQTAHCQALIRTKHACCVKCRDSNLVKCNNFNVALHPIAPATICCMQRDYTKERHVFNGTVVSCTCKQMLPPALPMR